MGIAASIFLGGAVWLWAWTTDPNFRTYRQAPAEVWYLFIAPILGTAAWCADTIIYLRRADP